MDNEGIGRRGELIFALLVTKRFPQKGRMFSIQFLGDKWPTTDYLVELIGADGIKPFCFFQVKSTRRGYSSKENRLKVSLSEKDMGLLGQIPVPTYVAGIDEENETGYIVSANGEQTDGFQSMSTAFPMDTETLSSLWREVSEFWEENFQNRQIKSIFIDKRN